MAISIDSRIWLATHLLYPNSSQAFDVYQSLITQSEDSIRKKNINFIFQKLYQIIEKIPAVSSNKAFHVFESNQTEQWQQIYKKSQKEQMIIFVGYFIFGLNLKDIAGGLKLTYEKAQFLFHQTFKKTIFTNIKVDMPEKISFKKYNEEKVSFLFTNENLIDYCLSTLSASEMKKVKIGLQLYPELQASQKQYDLIVKQMNQLIEFQDERVTKPLIQISEPLSMPRETLNLAVLFSRHKTLVTSVTLSVFCIALVLVRPQWIQHLTESSKDHFVILQEVKPKQNVSEEIQNPAPPLNLTDLSIQTDPKNNTVVKNDKVDTKNTKNSGKPVATEKTPDIKPISIQPVKIAVAIPHEHQEATANAQPKKSGGLYRGVLVVTDINEVTPKITERLVDIGGKKAGEVELGWRKSEKFSYYHFTLPENNVDTMKEFLAKFGSLQIQYENHPRLMPAGVKRLIIEVKERE